MHPGSTKRMLYKSTRGGVGGATFEQVLQAGYAFDGGLFVPEDMPEVSLDTLRAWQALDYRALCVEVLQLFAGDCISEVELRALVQRCFAGFSRPEVVPMARVGRVHVAELFHGPTLAFKDFGQQVLCRLLDFFAARRGGQCTLVVATTGDTGPAAIAACTGAACLRIFVNYPLGQVSRLQERQMTTVNEPNVRVIGFEGGGDDMDKPIKRITTDAWFKARHGLTSVNSINLGRVIVQTVHYFWAYLRTCEREAAAGRTSAEFALGDPVNFCIPTGAMGNMAAGSFARRMGLPIGFLAAGVNANDIVDRALSRGEFQRRDLVRTLSEAINIQLPYNMERLLFYEVDEDPERLSRMMAHVDARGGLTIDEPTLTRLRAFTKSAMITDEVMLCTIRTTWRDHGYLVDPHTAVALACADAVGWPVHGAQGAHSPPTVVLATAHACKFEEALRAALGDGFWESHMEADGGLMPASARALAGLPDNNQTLFADARKGADLSSTQDEWEARLRAMITDDGTSGRPKAAPPGFFARLLARL